MKTGLVMEGGGMRGMFTAGVTDVLMEAGISFDGAAGTSAGAVFGCNVKSHQPGRAIRYSLRFCRDPRYLSLKSWLTTGDLYNKDFAYHEVPYVLDPFDVEAFRHSTMEFYAVCTDVESGRAVYHRCSDGAEQDIEWFRASASMPLVSRVVEIDGHGYLDGGIADSIPLAFLRRQGYERNLVILTRPRDYRKKRSRASELTARALSAYPKAARAMRLRHLSYNRALEFVASEEAAGRAFVIAPAEELHISRASRKPEELRRVYALGREAAEKLLPEIRTFFFGNASGGAVPEKTEPRFLFRDIRAEEAEKAADIEEICFPPNEACSRAQMKARALTAPELFLVAEDRQTGRIAGFLNGLSTDETVFRDDFFRDASLHNPAGETVMLLGLDVLPEYRKRGLAGEIVREYRRRESARGRKRLILTCLEAKVPMYEHLHFRDLGLSASVWGGEAWHEMVMELS